MPRGQFARCLLLALALLSAAHSQTKTNKQAQPDNPCHRPASGSVVPEPRDLRSRNGELKVDLRIHNYTGADGSPRYCYTTADGAESPTLRLNPGDLLVLNLKN